MKTEMTLELFNIAMKYQEKFKKLREFGVGEYEAEKILHEDWKIEKLENHFGFYRTRKSVQFMLKLQKKFYLNKDNKLMSDKEMRKSKFFII